MDKGGFYYLLENGSIIWTKELTEPVGGINRLWPVRANDWGFAWQVVTEAMALDAKTEDVSNLVNKWDIGGESEAQKYAENNHLRLFHLRLFMDGDLWCATFDDFEDLQQSCAGFGSTPLKALAALAKVAFKKEDTKSGGNNG